MSHKIYFEARYNKYVTTEGQPETNVTNETALLDIIRKVCPMTRA